MYYRFGKAFYFVSILAFVFFLLYFYSAMPEQVGISVDETGIVNRDWEKGTFFYAMIATFLIFNAATLFTPKSLETKTNKKMHRIFPVGDPYRDYILAWFYSFGALINLSLGLLVFYVHAINNQEEIAASSFSFWFFLMPSLLFVWVVMLFVLLVGKFKSVQRS
ncbi:DNA topoisomerase IV [Algoriphagus sp. AK58]|uniref:DNA topoisomerase IV n=1 Tax=Algoriphagus sp. AK58 TaxID=1406877 RepID=UPI00164F39D4|nr:DNA topoisomerase IV [Algoriphagus sp. AK58]MBC6366119.1 DNA topoisomerase IV [Algoriphagus sp. AK58]